MQTKAKIFGLASFCAHRKCSGSTHMGQFLDDDATIIAANGPLCTPHIPRQHASTSLIDIHQYRTRPRPRFVMIVTSTFLQILMLLAMNKKRYEPSPPLFIRHMSNPRSSHIILAVVPIDTAVGYALV